MAKNFFTRHQHTAFLRRTFLKSAATGLAAASLSPWKNFVARAATQQETEKLSPEDVLTTGEKIAGLESFDELMTGFQAEHQVPGASLAVTKNSRLVYARGFGYSDRENNEPVEPAALFRIASVSKPLTAIAVLQLIEQGKVALEDNAFNILQSEPHLEDGAIIDPRLAEITVRQCLQHTAGWDRGASFDPIGRAPRIARSLGVELPVGPKQIVRYMMGQPLDFDPGQKHAYSNLGYLVLGRIIEKVSAMPYEQYVREQVLAPVGVSRTRLGHGALEERAAGEVKYYDPQNRERSAVVGPNIGQRVPLQYGGENLDGYEAHGGWISSAVDLVRFSSAFDDPTRSKLLRSETIEAMMALPEGLAGHDADGSPSAAFYGCGWMVRPVGSEGAANIWHSGFIAGTSTLLVNRWDDLNWAVLFNTHACADGSAPAGKIDSLIHQAAGKVERWPNVDMFDRYLRS